MGSGEVKPGGWAASESVAALALMLLAVACAMALLWVKRARPPIELPSLSLSRDEVEAALAADARAAARAPDDKPALELEALLLEQAKAELRGIEGQGRWRRRHAAMADAYARVVAAHGEKGALALRARAVERLDEALDLKLPAEQLQTVIGGLPHELAREGMAIDGELVAPRFVVRSLAKARWNVGQGLPPDHALSPVEKQAFFGWRALHAERARLRPRLEALQAYAAAGGRHVEEARAVLLLRGGELAAARVALERAYAEHPSWRLRNGLLALHRATARRPR